MDELDMLTETVAQIHNLALFPEKVVSGKIELCRKYQKAWLCSQNVLV